LDGQRRSVILIRWGEVEECYSFGWGEVEESVKDKKVRERLVYFIYKSPAFFIIHYFDYIHNVSSYPP
jgi:hypothetical protein